MNSQLSSMDRSTQFQPKPEPGWLEHIQVKRAFPQADASPSLPSLYQQNQVWELLWRLR